MTVTLLTPIIFTGASLAANAATLFTESWETPNPPAGASTSSLPAPWVKFTGPASSSFVVHPSASDFDAASPLSSPASGDQALGLTGTNTGITRLSILPIAPDTIYTISAATGNSKATADDQFWSLQLWADSDGNGSLGGADAFLGQQFGTSGTAVIAPAGGWATNSFSFDSGADATHNGARLIVLLNNFQSGTSYYDSVELSATPIPEPSRWLLVSLAAILGFINVSRRRRR